MRVSAAKVLSQNNMLSAALDGHHVSFEAVSQTTICGSIPGRREFRFALECASRLLRQLREFGASLWTYWACLSFLGTPPHLFRWCSRAVFCPTMGPSLVKRRGPLLPSCRNWNRNPWVLQMGVAVQNRVTPKWLALVNGKA